MVRPRGGDFIYSEAEFEDMKKDVLRFRDYVLDSSASEGAADTSSAAANVRVGIGFVFGVLTAANVVDKERNRELVELAGPFPCTFHRACDEIDAPAMRGALEDVVDCGFRSILTSGGGKGESGWTAVDGCEVIADLVQAAKGRVDVIIGGGVRARNARVLKERIPGAEYFHSSAILEGDVPSKEEIGGLISGFSDN